MAGRVRALTLRIAKLLGWRRAVSPPLGRQRIEPDARPAPAGPVARRPVEAFTPTRPKAGRRQIVGREAELSRIVQAVVEEGAHVVLYSERGRGKTSLANLATETLRRHEHVVARYTCEASSTFGTIMRGLARDLPASLLASNVSGSEGCEAALPDGDVRPQDVVALPDRLNCRTLVFVIDEFDRVQDEPTRTLLADAIKQASDRVAGLSFVVVGVSDTLEQIIGQHPSIQRSLTAIHLPLLSDDEIGAMLEKGGRDSGLTFPPGVIDFVAMVARGMPYMAQLLGLRIAQAALARGAERAAEDDVAVAVERLLADARHHISGQYERLTDRGRDVAMVHALRRIALADSDRWGRMAHAPHAGGAIVGGREVGAAQWERLWKESILHAPQDAPNLLTFTDRALVYHVLLLSAREALAQQDAVVTPITADPRMRRSVAAGGR